MLYALPCFVVELDADVDELAPALAVVARDAVRVLRRPLVCHLARAPPQDVKHREHRDDWRSEREQRQNGHAVADRPLGEPEADSLLDVVCRIDGDEPCDSCDDDGLADHHEAVTARLCVAPLDDEMPFAVALTFADQHKPEQGRDSHQYETGGTGDEVHNALQCDFRDYRCMLTNCPFTPLGSYNYILP